jgi:two-component system LytT family sensor kinase
VPRRVRSAFTAFGFFTAVGLLLFAYRYLDYAARNHPIPVLVPLIEQLTGAWMAALPFPFLIRFARRYSNLRRTWPLHLLAMALFSVVHTSLMWLTRSLLFPVFGLGPYDYGIMSFRFPMEFFNDVIVYWIIVSILYLFDHRVQSAQLEGKLATARLQNLRLQLQPHFLFNALNTISSVMYEDPRKADSMISRLSDLLRHTLQDSGEQEVPLENEIRTLELYLEIMRKRFEDNLSVDIRIAPEVERALVPQLLLQPLVENSIRHGVNPLSHAVNITVTAVRQGDSTRLQVRDSGCGLNGGPMKKGTGLSNTAERLRELYGARHQLAFENCDDGGLLVTVAVPFHT